MKGNKRGLVVLGIVVVALVIGGLVALSFKSRSDAAKRMESNLLGAGYIANIDASWKDECVKRNRNGTCKKTESELDAPTTIAGCPLTLESKDNGKTFKLDEINWGSDPDGLDVADGDGGLSVFTTPNPRREQVYDYLATNASRLSCFKANPNKA